MGLDANQLKESASGDALPKMTRCALDRPSGPDDARPMPTISDAIDRLQREIGEALGAGVSLPNGCTLSGERASLSLGLEINEAGYFVVSQGLRPAIHQVTLEFRVHRMLAPAEVPSDTANPDILAALSEIFGEPGFDSAARATVFREALEELTEEQRKAALTSLTGAEPLVEEAPVARARRLIARTAASGPAKARGVELLERLAIQVPVSRLIESAEKHWRTQSEIASGQP